MDHLRDLDSMDFHMQFVNDVLRKLHGLFRNCLDFQSISPQLRAHNLLTDHEWQMIGKKESREQQVDEFLKCLPHKGRNCLNQLIKCLLLSLDHSGHQDILSELKKLEKRTADSPTDDQIYESGDPQDSSQNEFEKVVSQFSSRINYLYLSETKVLNEKIKQQNAEIERLELKCTNYVKTIQQLEETNEALKQQLHEKETMLESLNNSAGDFESDVLFGDVSCESCEEETSSNVRVSSSLSPAPQFHTKRSYSELPNQHAKLSKESSLEDKMKAYQQKIKSFRNKCQTLEVDKESLKNEKDQLEYEVSKLKQQLDAVSVTSHSSLLSHNKGLSHSCSSLYDKDLAIKANTTHESDDSAVEESSTSVFSRFTSIIRNPVKRASKFGVSPEPQTTNPLVNNEISDIFPKDTDMEYLNPIRKGWLIKEGGHKRSLKKRWCIITSQFFFYFEKEDQDFKRPLGILPLTSDMQVIDSAKENCFEIFKKSRTNMTSCKLDKSRSGYVPGNHASYNLQASCDEDKKRWIEVFQKVFEILQHS